jgi:chromosome segregation ATPase
VLRISIVTLILLVLSAVAPVQAQPCQCIDIGDIKARMAEANAAIAAYSAEIQKMAEQIQRTRELIPYTQARRKKLQENIQPTLDRVAAGRISPTPSGGHPPGGTSNLCQIEIFLHPSATACMRESIKRHEQHHSSECRKTLSAGRVLDSAATGKDRFERTNTQLMEYAMEEIGGYTTEIAFLQSELTRLAQSEECNPKPKPRLELREYSAQPRQGRTR